MLSSSFLASAYRGLMTKGEPLARIWLAFRARRGREDPTRLRERQGFAGLDRPSGPLVWAHAASVGEALSVLGLIARLREVNPALTCVLTTGTVTSARLVESRRVPGVLHQYAPLDVPLYRDRFLDHWKPALALWVESELWPNLLEGLKHRGIPTVLVNGRLSARSTRRWRLASGWAREVLSAFVLGLAQEDDSAARFAALGLHPVRAVGNLKYGGEPLACDPNDYQRLRTEIGHRPVWLMASTHPGEDEMAAAVHLALRAAFPGLLTLIVPRHPTRSEAIATLLQAQGLTVVRRSRAEPVGPIRDVLLGDTLGEMGLWYRLASVVVLGGSFTWGGHNPVEPARLGCTLLWGPRMTNFAAMAETFRARGAALTVANRTELIAALHHVLGSPSTARALAKAAACLAAEESVAEDRIVEALRPWVPPTTL